jgi:hypothetical protein
MIYPKGEISNFRGEIHISIQKIQITKINFNFPKGNVEEIQ